MANPLTTVSDWVPNILNPKILFITENYPDNPNNIIGNTYFYRTLNQNIHIFGANNLLNNICRTFNIIAENEYEKLNIFLNKRTYFLIDSFPHGERMSNNLINRTINNIEWIDRFLDDLIFINPKQIIFTCVGSNGRLLPVLLNRAEERNLNVFQRLVNYNENINVFHSPSNRAYPTFNRQILNTIEEGRLEI